MCCLLILTISDNISCAVLALSVLRKSSSFYCLQPSFILLQLDQRAHIADNLGRTLELNIFWLVSSAGLKILFRS
ncbi:hypothetical protein D5086_001939 [Populus alba]|uniref:Uncharacterized protein n=1 Tax=Populus alba TaxID=43335 RepID=A0ACC4D0N5_POPAL